MVNSVIEIRRSIIVIFLFTLAFFLLGSLIVTDNSSAATQKGFKYEIEFGKAYIYGYKGKSSKVTVPAKLGGKKVASIVLKSRKIKRLNVSKCKHLKNLELYNSKIKKLNLRKNKKLKFLELYNMPLKTLDISKNKSLVLIDCANLKLKKLNLQSNTKLSRFAIDNVGIAQPIDFSNNKKLDRIRVCNTNLGTIDINENSKLEYLDCINTNLSTIDLTNNTKLEYLNISKNSIATLDISNLVYLREIDISYNKGLSIDISNNKRLTWLCFSPGPDVADISYPLLKGTIYTNAS